MSNIKCEKKDLLFLKDFISDIKNNGLSRDSIETALNNMIPSKNGKLLVRYHISEKGLTTAAFFSQSNIIKISLNGANEWLNKNIKDFMTGLKASDEQTLRSYFILFMLSHEIEHSYQYLIGKGIVESPSVVLKNAYKGIFDLLNPKDSIIPNPISKFRNLISIILYKINQNLYLLERNANVESLDLVCQCALFNDREDIFNLFNDMRKTFLKCGYQTSGIGSVEETYQKILMHNKYKKFYKCEHFDEENLVRFGFNINDEVRNKILVK